MRPSKRFKVISEQVDTRKIYRGDEASELVKKYANVKFDESVDLSVKVNLKRGQSLRDTLVLPHQMSVEKTIVVFARDEKADEAKSAGAQYVGDQDLVEKISGGWLDFDVVIATPNMMREIAKLGPVLGRRGLMPNPKNKTITNDIDATIKELKKGRVEIRSDKAGVVNLRIGKASMGAEHIATNIEAVVNEIRSKKPSDVKGEFVLSATLSSTMGPGIKVVV